MRILIISLLFLFSFYQTRAQNAYLKDSLSLEVEHEPHWIYEHPYVVRGAHKFYYLDEKTGKVRMYDSTGTYMQNIGAQTDYEKKNVSSCRRANSILVFDTTIAISYGSNVLHYSYKNEYLFNKSLWNVPTKKRSYGVNFLETGTKSIHYDQKSDFFFLPLMKRQAQSGRVDTSFYFHKGQIGKFSPAEKAKTYQLSTIFDKRADIYGNKLLPYLLDAGFHVNQKQNKIYAWQEANSTIRVYDYQGHLLRTFGQKAQHPGHHDGYISASKKAIKRYQRDFFLQGEKKKNYMPRIYRLQTLQYRYVSFIPEKDLFLRTYRPGISTSEIPNKLSDDKYKEIKKLCQSPLECGPGPDPMMKYLLVQEFKKPTGLQLYNKEGKLLFDQIVAKNYPMRPIGVENGKVYFKGRYDHASKQYWIYTIELDTLL